MFRFALFSAIIFAPQIAIADEICREGSSEVLRLVSWSIEENHDLPNDLQYISVTMSIPADGDIRMIDGLVIFTDVLGKRIGEAHLKRDQIIISGSTHQETILTSMLDRLHSITPADVVASICVNALVYNDGSILDFSKD